MSTFEVMKAAKLDLGGHIKFPGYVSPKIDGRRTYIENGVAYTSSGKPVKNRNIQLLLGRKELNGLDGELTVGDIVDPDAFRNTGAVSSVDGDADGSVFNVFDRFSAYDEGFSDRLAGASVQVRQFGKGHVKLIRHYPVNDVPELLVYEEKFLNAGYEGLMYRSLEGPYKYGRSTFREGYLLKLKRFVDGEAEVTGFAEMMHNDNEKTLVGAGGKAKRSTKKEGKVSAGVLGTLLCRDLETGGEVELGTGFTAAERTRIWDNRLDYYGVIAKYKRFDIGNYGKPRHPVFLGFRDRDDM